VPAGGRELVLLLIAMLAALALTACGALTPTPTPTPVPAPTSTPAPTPVPPPRTSAASQPQAQPTFDPATASPADVENAFLSNVDDLIAETADLTVTPCPDLMMLVRDNPNLVASVRGFAAAAKRIGATQAVLNTDAVKAELSDLDHSMGELEGALSLCGIKQP
jgi:ABC-type transport system substrate-binding protein